MKTIKPAEIGLNNFTILSNKKLDVNLAFDKFLGGGRPRLMSFEMVMECLDMKTKYSCENWKGLYSCIIDNKKDWKLPTYGNFLHTIKTFLLFLMIQIQWVLNLNRIEFFTKKDKIAFVDSTPLPVCKTIRSGRHKTMKEFAEYSKSTMGWYYGFKLHLTCDYETKNPIHLMFSNAKLDDRKYLEKCMTSSNLFFQSGTMFVADKGYQAEWLENLAKETGNYLLTGKRKSKKMKILASQFDIYLLHNRAKIESVFGTLKQNHFLASTRSRSIIGYLFTYIFSIFSYLKR